ncbi:MAG: hypothetical protein ACK4NU_03595 [Brevundimonas sp.]
MVPYDLTLDEILADPMVRQLMHRDGVAEAQIRGLADHVRRRPGPRFGPDAPRGRASESPLFAP